MSQAPKDFGPAIHCSGLTKRFGPLTAVDGLALDIQPGECFGLLGPNGAGKTTTIELLEGLTRPDQGLVELLGSRWGKGQDQHIRSKIGVQLQETQLADKLTVEETVRLFRSFYPSGRHASEVIELVGMTPKSKGQVYKLSGGQRQRLAMACALVGEPDILFLDEPTTGLDPQARLRIWDIIEAFRRQGVTVLLTTHYMEEAARLCDRVAIMDQGRIIAEDTPQALIDSLGAEQIVEFSLEGELGASPLAALTGVKGVTQRNGLYRMRVGNIGEALPALLALLREQAVTIDTLKTYQPTLEDVFIHLTGRSLRDE